MVLQLGRIVLSLGPTNHISKGLTLTYLTSSNLMIILKLGLLGQSMFIQSDRFNIFNGRTSELHREITCKIKK